MLIQNNAEILTTQQNGFSTNTIQNHNEKKKTIKKNCFNFYLFKKLLFTMENATTAGYFLDKLEILTFATQKYLYNQ